MGQGGSRRTGQGGSKKTGQVGSRRTGPYEPGGLGHGEQVDWAKGADELGQGEQVNLDSVVAGGLGTGQTGRETDPGAVETCQE
jgi:hypothetical protein